MSLAGARRSPILRPVAGFESTAYAWAGRRLVWAGADAQTDHPRNWHRPWSPVPLATDAAALRAGARMAIAQLARWPARGLLPWLAGEALPFPLHLAQARFEALRVALHDNNVQALAAVAPRLLGLGPGLTPSGDDLLGGVFFALAHAPRPHWAGKLRALQRELHRAARAGATNPISAALLHDLMRGRGWRVLHEMLAALQARQAGQIDAAAHALLALGATSGADLLCGLLLTLASTPRPIASTLTAQAAALPAQRPACLAHLIAPNPA